MNIEEFLNSSDIKSLNDIIVKSSVKPEGNCLYWHNSFNFRSDINSENVRQNLYTLAKTSKNVLEIGFNGGH